MSKGRASFTSATDTLQPAWPGAPAHWEPRRADLFTDGPLTREDLNTLERNDERAHERERKAQQQLLPWDGKAIRQNAVAKQRSSEAGGERDDGSAGNDTSS